jgi:hypothetical protein
MCACNRVGQAVRAGHKAPFIASGKPPGELAARDSDAALGRPFAHLPYVQSNFSMKSSFP